MRAVKPRAWAVQKATQALIRTFGAIHVQIERPRRTFTALKAQVIEPEVVYQGEALEIPAGGDVATFGLGQVENKQPRLMIAGKRDVRQGDFVTLHSRRYQVEFDPTWFDAYTLLTLKQWEQSDA